MWQQKIAAVYQKQYRGAALPHWLQQTVWQKVELHKKSKRCRVIYQRDTAFSPQELEVVENLFHSMLPADIRVELVRDAEEGAVGEPSVEKKQNQQGESVRRDAVLKNALAALYEKKPKAKLWLLSCVYTWTEGDKLQIAFPTQAAKENCAKLGVELFLGEYLSERLGNPCQVALCFEQELQHSIMAAAEKREEKIIASALTAQKVSRGYSGPIYGKYIYDSPIPISAVFTREDFCVVRGEIITVTESQLKSGKTVHLLTIYDDTGYLQVKISAGKDKEFFSEYLTPGQWIKCRGKYGMDRFSGEVLFSAFDVEGISHPVWGSDFADEKRVELALHTKEENFNSLIPIEQGVYTAAKWGQHGLGVANRHSAAAFPALWESCKTYGIKAVYGMELVVLKKETQIGRVTLWARDPQGLAILYELLSMALSHGAGVADGIEYDMLSRIFDARLGKAHICCALDWQDFSEENWQSCWQGMVDYLLAAPVETKEAQQRQKAVLYRAKENGINIIATDGASCYSEGQTEMVRFLRENGGNAAGTGIRKITSTDSLIKAFYYLGEDMAEKIVVETPEKLCHKTASFPPIGGEALGYPRNDDFWQTVLTYSKRKYDGVIPREILVQLEAEKKILAAKGYYWLYPILLQIKEKYGSLFIQDHLLTSYVLGLSRENPLPYFVYCHDCGFSGAANAYLCPNCGHWVQEFGMGTVPEEGTDWQPPQKIILCGAAEKKEQIWQDLAMLLDDCQLIAPGAYRQLSWESTEAMAEIFLAGLEREELPGERQWFAATCQGMLLGVEGKNDTCFLIPKQENIYQLTPVLEREGTQFTYFPEEILSPFVLSLHYQTAEKQQLFWDIYRLLPPYRQTESMAARNWAEKAVWKMLKNHYWQGIPYLEQLEEDREILSVDDFARAVADSIGMVSVDMAGDGVSKDSTGEELPPPQEEAGEEKEMRSAAAGLQSTEGLFRQFGEEIGLAWDICWMKAHAPEVFYTVALNNLADRSNFRDMWLGKIERSGKLGQLIKEMQAQNIDILPIDVNLSGTENFILTEKGILASLDSTAAFDSDLINSIALSRSQEKFSSQKDFFQRLNISPHLQHLFLTEQLLDRLPEESQTSLF